MKLDIFIFLPENKLETKNMSLLDLTDQDFVVPSSTFIIDRRMNKALTEHMFLLSAHRHKNGWLLFIKGSTGKHYKIVISKHKFGCDCIDFQFTEVCCKHIYFIVGRILNEKTMMKNLDPLNPWSLELDEKLSRLFNNRKYQIACENKKRNRDNNTNSTKLKRIKSYEETKTTEVITELPKCAICYEDISTSQMKWSCKTCVSSHFHEPCINLWFIKTCSKRKGIPHCPLCRTPIIQEVKEEKITKLNKTDPFLHFTEFTQGFEL